MAKAIAACIIVRESGMDMVYQKKCESCGYVLPGTTISAPVHPGTAYHDNFVCPKCKAKNKITIQG